MEVSQGAFMTESVFSFAKQAPGMEEGMMSRRQEQDQAAQNMITSTSPLGDLICLLESTQS